MLSSKFEVIPSPFLSATVNQLREIATNLEHCGDPTGPYGVLLGSPEQKLNTRNAKIIKMWQDGFSHPQIARSVQITVTRIKKVIEDYRNAPNAISTVADTSGR